MNKKILSSSIIGCLTVVGVTLTAVAIFSNKKSEQVVVDVEGATCVHSGYHYSEVVPTDSKVGHAEFWACCKCTTQFLEQPEGTFVDHTDAQMVGGCNKGHVAYLPKLTETLEADCEKRIEFAAHYGYTSCELTADIDMTDHARNEYYDIDIDGVTLDMKGHSISVKNGGVEWIGENATIKNGEFIGVESAAGLADYSYAICLGNDGGDATDIVVDDVYSTNTGFYLCGGKATVKSTNGLTSFIGHHYGYACYADEYSDIIVEGGKFTKGTAATTVSVGDATGSVQAKGGNFTDIEDQFIASGYKKVEKGDGTYDVIEDSPVIPIVNVKDKAELQAALNADLSEGVVIQLADNTNYGDVIIDDGGVATYSQKVHNNTLAQTIEFDYSVREINNVTIKGGTNSSLDSIQIYSGRKGATSGYALDGAFPEDPNNGQQYAYYSNDINGLTVDGVNFVGAGIYTRVGEGCITCKEHVDNGLSLGALENVVVKNCDFTWTAGKAEVANFHNGGFHCQNGTGNAVTGDTSTNTRYVDVVIKDCTFHDITQNDTSAIYFGCIDGVKVDGCRFTNVKYNAFQVANECEGKVEIVNNTFVSTGSRTIRMNAGSTYVCTATSEVKGNTFYAKTAGSQCYVKNSIPSWNLAFGVNTWETIPADATSTYFQGVTINLAEQIQLSA